MTHERIIVAAIVWTIVVVVVAYLSGYRSGQLDERSKR